MNNIYGYRYDRTGMKRTLITKDDDTMTPAQRKLEAQRKYGIARMLERQAAETAVKEQYEHSRGYCPHCHMLIPVGRDHCECED